MKTFGYYDQDEKKMVYVDIKYPEELKDHPDLIDLANYVARHVSEEDKLIRVHSMDRKLFMEQVKKIKLDIVNERLLACSLSDEECEACQ